MDRDAIIETEESTKRNKKIQPDFSSYNKLKEVSFRIFLLTLTDLKRFLLIWQKRKKTFIWKDRDLEDFLLRSNGLFREKLDALADIITHFPETKRLCSFLKDI